MDLTSKKFKTWMRLFVFLVLVYLFNGISTFMDYEMLRLSLKNNSGMI